jgi:5-methylcytosine-specific restriction endonuclease McrA
VPHSDPEKRRAYQREYIKRTAERHRQQSKEAMRRWRQRHPEEHNAQNRTYYARDPARRQQQINASPNRNAVRRAMHERRRARSLHAPGSYSVVEWLSLVAEHHDRCAYCGILAPLDADHRVPLSRGGSNFIENIIPSCRSCNLRKHTLTEAEFRARLAAENDRQPPVQLTSRAG